MADFALSETDFRQILSEVRLLDWQTIAEDASFRSGLLDFPEEAEEQIIYDGTNTDGELLLHWCGIHIRISRNLIAFRFPALFKTWADFPYFRMGLDRFLCTFLRPFQCRQLLFLPSHWTQRESGIHNDWQRKRLQQMQQQITTRENSFKRCRLHLQHCLGDARVHPHADTYPYYVESDFFSLDAGPLRITAALRTPIAPTRLPAYAAALTRDTVFSCCPEVRDNACPMMGYNRYSPADIRSCRLQPYYDMEKFADLDTAIRTEARVRWNAHCFFSLELHADYVELRFHRGAPELLYGNQKAEILRLLRGILSDFPIGETLLYAATCREALPEDADFQTLKQHLCAHYAGYSRLEDMDSWNEGYLLLETFSL